MAEKKLILYISMSLDGFIATKDDDISWLNAAPMADPEEPPMPEEFDEVPDYYKKFTDNIDTYIVGRKTYDVVTKLTGGKLPHLDKFDRYVLTSQERKPENGFKFYNGDLETLVKELKAKGGKNIYCDGGGEVVKSLLEKDLIDEFIVTIIPIILGDGKRLFIGGTPTIELESFKAKNRWGYVELRYQRRGAGKV
ncbi:MAG: dihydrofolate reductase [Flavobacteriales bacterium]|nr:dihydrofolate reductase [Flavobacteriales bacterium]